MRFCPFCSAENADELAACQACGRRLPPLPPRRTRNAPPTGVQLPPRAAPSATAPPPLRKSGSTAAPPSGPYTAPVPPISATMSTVAAPPAALGDGERTVMDGQAFAGATALDAAPFAPPGPVTTTTRVMPEPVTVARESAPSLPPPPTGPTPTIGSPLDDAARRALLGALSPGPAAARREPAAIPRVTSGEPGRRRADGIGSLPPQNAATNVITAQVEPATSVYAAQTADDAPTSMHAAAPPHMPPPTPARGQRPSTQGPSLSGARAGSQPALVPPPPPSAPPGPPARAASQPALTPPPLPTPLIVAERPRPTGSFPGATEPPQTRIQRGEVGAERPFTPPKVSSVPEIPEPGLINAARYAARFARARYQRRGAIKALGVEIKQDTEALDQVLGALGREARTRGIENRVFSAENAAITGATERIAALQREGVEVDARKADENSKFGDVERERTTKLSEAERSVEEAQRELLVLEGQRRGLRDRRKDLERRQKAHLKAAEDQDRQAGAAQLGDQRSELRRAGESHRREAAAIEPERQDCERQLAAIERPIAEATARQDAARAELDAAKRSLADAREGHTHRLAELDAEAKRKAREIGLAEAEIARRLVTLGTLVNLNRIEDPSFSELYLRIDRLRGAITARTTEIEKLTAERDAYDRGMLVRGVSVMAGAFVLLIALIVILRAIL